MADITDSLQKMKVPELKQALKDRGLPVSGTKPELIKRLGEALGTSFDAADDGLEDSLQGIDDILNDDSVQVPTKKPPAAKPAPAVAAPVKTATPAPKQATVIPPQKVEAVSSNGVSANKPSTEQMAADTTHLGKPAEVAKLSDAERQKMRAEKFGITSEDTKKDLRAQRFGLPASGTKTTTKLSTDEVDKLKKRAERFGTVVSTSLSKVEEEDRKKKRAERFGIASSTTAPGKRPITINSSDPDIEAKKKKRAERFGLAT